MSDLRVGLVDANELVRVGRALVVNSQPEMRVAFESSSPQDAIDSAPDYLLDAVLLGPSNFQVRGRKFTQAFCEAMRSAGNEAAVITYDSFTTDKLRYEAYVCGAREFVGLDQTASDLLKVLKGAVKSDYLANPNELRRLGELFGFLSSNLRLEDELSELTESQTKMIDYFVAGERDLAISKLIEVPRVKVTQTIENLLSVSGFSSRNQLALSLMGSSR